MVSFKNRTLLKLCLYVLVGLPVDGAQEVPKHVGDCISTVFMFHCM